MGAVYKARQLNIGRIVAVKTIHPHLCSDVKFLQRFRGEAEKLGQFNDSHIVQIHEAGADRGIHFLVMEFVDGETIRLAEFGGFEFGVAPSAGFSRLKAIVSDKPLLPGAEKLLGAELLNHILKSLENARYGEGKCEVLIEESPRR